MVLLTGSISLPPRRFNRGTRQDGTMVMKKKMLKRECSFGEQHYSSRRLGNGPDQVQQISGGNRIVPPVPVRLQL